ncbi:transcriptional regulator [Salmonella enterica]|nr:transcriptional regulator [Salmonella enterica]EBR4546810.1 helix-turn-helix domain-containing protein [Salmonella enterica]EBZ0012544.1 transcriptional regulator [Salmonella enterica subsp. enterica serovar Suberu]
MKLEKYLTLKKIKQQDFAITVGKTQGYISRIANETCKLKGDEVIKWAAATNYAVTPHDLRPDLYPNPNDGLPETKAA